MSSVETSAAQGDIVSVYPKIVGTFVLMRIVCWTILILEMCKVDMHGIDSAIVETSSAMEICYCQLMFYGTLHYGLISSARLENICRVAFFLDGTALLVKGFTVFSADTVEDLIAGMNATAMGVAQDMSSSIQGGIIWFGAMAIYSMWVGVQMLAVSRVRIFDYVPRERLAAFSDRNTKIYAVSLAIQVLIGGALVVYACVNDESPEAEVRFSKTIVAVTQLSFAIGQAYTFKMLIFDTCGQTIRGWLRGEPGMDGRRNPIHKAVAVTLTFLWMIVVVLATIFALIANSTTDGFEYQTLAMGTMQLHNAFQFSAWAVFCHDMGMNRTHLFKGLEKGEERFKIWRDALPNKATSTEGGKQNKVVPL